MIADGISPSQRNEIPSELQQYSPHKRRQEAKYGHAGCEDMFGGLAGILSCIAIVPSSLATYERWFEAVKAVEKFSGW